MVSATFDYWASMADATLGASMTGKAADPRAKLTVRARNALLPRNAWIDSIFYNITERDAAQVAHFAAPPQGSIIYLSPEEREPLVFFPDAVEFLSHASHLATGAITIAGVGSSAIGAAGLARDVATATRVPVAAVVSGYGIDDLMYEAMGGAFFLRETNELEFLVEQAQDSLKLLSGWPGLLAQIETYDSIGSGPDIATIKSLLRAQRLPKLKWVVGHSKGSIILGSAINELVCEGAAVNLDGVNVVLFSAITAVAPGVGKQTQIIGSLDALGWANSRLNIPCRIVPNAMHHLNTRYALYLDAQAELRRIQA